MRVGVCVLQCVCVAVCVCVCVHTQIYYKSLLQKSPIKVTYILQKRPIILRSLLIAHKSLDIMDSDRLHFTCVRVYTLQHTATYCNTLQHTATHCNTLLSGYHGLLSFTFHVCACVHTATHCNTLQHTATHCNTLQHTATHFNTL